MKASEYFRSGFVLMENVLPLSIINIMINIMSSLLNRNAILNILSFQGIHVAFKFSLPSVIVDLWNFIEVPHQGVEVNVGFMTFYDSQARFTFLIIVSLGLAFIYAFIAYFYLYVLFTKGMHLDIKINLKRILDLFIYHLIMFALALMLILTSRVIVMLLLYVIILLIINYFIYASPFIIVGFNKEVSEALVRSVLVARKNIYLSYTILYIIIMLLISPILTLIAVNGKIPGMIIASILAGPPGLWLTASTTLMVTNILKESNKA